MGNTPALRLKKILPYVVAIVAFIVLGYLYAPYTLQGRVVNQSDISSWNGMAHELVEWDETHPDDPAYWTNSMFGGMPATTIFVKYRGDLTKYLYNILFIGQRPASYLILSMIGAFLMFLAFGLNIWIAIFGAIAVSFCSYNMQIIQVGHNTKMIAIAFMPWVIAAVVWAYRKAPFWGSLLFAFAISFQIKANHPQISYYLAIIVFGFVIYQLCKALKERWFGRFIKTSILLLLFGLLGIATNINHLWPTYEYGTHTMRWGSELTNEEEGEKSKGLDLDYATSSWSYGIDETPNLFIPNFNGGASVGSLGSNSAMYKQLTQEYNYADRAALQTLQYVPLYWGPQGFTAGPMYMGAVAIFLFILGLIIIKGGVKWWIAGVSLIALILGWGSHFMAPTQFFFNHVPLYNKFRTVSMILVVLQITIPILAAITLGEILKSLKGEEGALSQERITRGMIWAAAITGGFAILFILFPSLAGNFSGSSDASIPKELTAALHHDRRVLLQKDALRSLLYVLLAVGILWLALKKKIKESIAGGALILLVLFDLWGIDKRYLNSSHFVSPEEFSTAWKLRPADKYILSIDNSLSYRVLDLSIDPFNNAYPSYWHKTIGGYSPAKMQRYQDLIERFLYRERNDIAKAVNGITTLEEAQRALKEEPILSMLNTRYIILNSSLPPIVNNFAYGNSWFVEDVVPAEDANEEINLLSGIKPRSTAVVAEEFLGKIPALSKYIRGEESLKENKLGIAEREEPQNLAIKQELNDNDDSDGIELTSYSPNSLIYHYKSATERVVLFSEIYYAPGWRAFYTGNIQNEEGKTESVEEKELEIFRANWILRGLLLPSGEGDITFTFLPQSFIKGARFSMIASGALVLCLLCGIIFLFVKVRRRED